MERWYRIMGVLVVFILSTSAACYAQQIGVNQTNAGLEIPASKSKRGGQQIAHIGFTLSYDADFKTPQWVAWELTKEKAEGTGKRANNFLPDPDVRGQKAYPDDYRGSGYDRGHMCPAGDMKWDRQAMQETFYMTNICPQNHNLNQGDWSELEMRIRSWAKKYGIVYVCCGPIYYDRHPLRIGMHKVAVPDAFFKVILLYDREEPKAVGFLYDNKAGHQKLSEYAVTVYMVEEVTDLDFFPSLSVSIKKKIKNEIPDFVR